MRTWVGFVVMLLVVLGAATAADQAPTFHGIKLGVALGSQFQQCPWNPPKEGDIPKYISPEKDDKGNTIPCFYDFGLFRPAAYPQVTGFVRLYERFALLRDAQGNLLPPDPMLPGQPTVFMELLVPASAPQRDGTLEAVTLEYLPLESERVRDALIKKYGASHPPEIKVNPKLDDWMGIKRISQEAWTTDWGELSLLVTERLVVVSATTSKVIRFERENKKDAF